MKILRQYSEELLQKYSRMKGKRNPKIVCRTKEISGSEGYACHYSGGEITLEAESSLAAVYGLNRLITGVASSHWPECIGEWSPRFPLRPLWIGCDADVSVGVSLPRFLSTEKKSKGQIEAFCRRVIDLGYNSILIGRREESEHPETTKISYIDFTEFLSVLREYGLKTICKPNFIGQMQIKCPLDLSYQDFIKKRLNEFLESIPPIDYLFFESQSWHPECLQHPLSREATQADLVRAEITAIESALQKKAVGLIYFLPAHDSIIAKQQAELIPDLCDDVSAKTIIAFPSVAGPLHADHLPPHPLWNTLRKRFEVSATQFLPIVNIGSVKQGEGLWPALSLDCVEKYINSCQRHSFAGVIALVNRLPSEKGLLDCSLWVASQAMWTINSPMELAETWFIANRPDLKFSQFSDALMEARDLVVKLSWLRSLQHGEKQNNADFHEECRVVSESLLARLKWLQIRFDREEKKRIVKEQLPSFYDYFSHFIVDARRLVSQTAQACNVSIMNLRKDEDNTEGFWTQRDRRFMLDAVHRGEPGSRMAQIHDESCLF